MEQKTIDSILKYVLKSKYSQFFEGIFTIKEFETLKINKKKCVLILFIDNISASKGHWVTIIKNDNILYYVDSYGLKPCSYMKNIKNIYFDIKYYFLYRLQSDFSTICGIYSIFFIHLTIECKFNLSCVSNTVITTFTKSKIKNDQKMVKYIQKIYPFFTKKKCAKFFCNSRFIINFEKCYISLCKQKKQV